MANADLAAFIENAARWIELSELDANFDGEAASYLPSRPEVAIHHTAPVKLYRGFASKLHHEVPNWVADGALFHVRIALDRAVAQRTLTNTTLAPALLDSANLYEAKERWHITLFVLMPDHLHAVLSFPRQDAMSQVIGDWKRFHASTHKAVWQQGYFDHRLRDDELGQQLPAKMNYIRQNPVAAGLCPRVEDWPWVIDPYAA